VEGTRGNGSQPTVVLVHGAWGDATGFDPVIRALQHQGYRVIGFANPLRGLEHDSKYLADLLNTIEGPVVLVGHSYGGAVITNAASGNDQVVALVYLNGWALDEGESIGQLLELNEGSLIPPALKEVAFTNPDGSEGVDLYLEQDAFPAAFAGDVDYETAGVMAAALRPWSVAALGAASGPPAWKSIPSWYLLGTEDKAIPPATQRFMAERAESTIEEIRASHAPFVSQPDAVTNLIVTAATATAGALPRRPAASPQPT
jgi:pimeloyl-ACP methyl ester carboxylesterase